MDQNFFCTFLHFLIFDKNEYSKNIIDPIESI